MRTLIDKIKNTCIDFDSVNVRKYMNRAILGTVLSLTYPTPNSNSSINPYQLSDNIIEHEIQPRNNSQQQIRQYTGRHNDIISLEDIADKSLESDIRYQFERTDAEDFEKIMARINKYNHLIESYSREHNLDDNLIASVIYHESSGNPKAISPKNALGLMQVTYDTARKITKKPTTRKEILSPEKNIALGSKYLSKLIDMFRGNVMLGLAAYNAGPTRLSKILKRNKINPESASWQEIEHLLPRETRSYVPKVFSGVLRMKESYSLKESYLSTSLN